MTCDETRLVNEIESFHLECNANASSKSERLRRSIFIIEMMFLYVFSIKLCSSFVILEY
jgi:hypothetical protein